MSVLFGVSIPGLIIYHIFLSPLSNWVSYPALKSGGIFLCHLNLNTPKTTYIVDIPKYLPRSLWTVPLKQSIWSNYKSHNTLKAFVAIQPNGAFTIISKLWSGNIRDRKITIDSKYLDNISPGDEVMADRGFQIKYL